MSQRSMRLQKFLSRAGVASRRAAERMMRAGRVRVNGQVVREMGVRIDPERDEVYVDGHPVERAEPVWIALHKPRGHVSTRSDPRGRPTLYDLIPESYHGLFHVGRLDIDSEGLILLTNQGDLAHRVLHPRYEVTRVYDVVVRGEVGRDELRRLRQGIELEDGPARALRAERRSNPRPGLTRVRVTMGEGRKRIVRRLFQALGFPVLQLVRRRFGPIRLGRLESGRWRRLSRKEVGELASSTTAKERSRGRRGRRKRRGPRGRRQGEQRRGGSGRKG